MEQIALDVASARTRPISKAATTRRENADADLPCRAAHREVEIAAGHVTPDIKSSSDTAAAKSKL
jgi:hypothetical protein